MLYFAKELISILMGWVNCSGHRIQRNGLKEMSGDRFNGSLRKMFIVTYVLNIFN